MINNYRLADNASQVTSMVRPVYAAGTARHIRNRFIISCICDLFGNGSDDLATKELAARQALAQPGSNLILYTDTNQVSPESLGNSITGLRITSGPDFIDSGQGEHVTIRRFRFTAEAEYLVGGSAGAILFWHETITRIGTGAPNVAMRFPVNMQGGIPQTITPSSPVRLIQSGQAIGHTEQPVIPLAAFTGNGVSGPMFMPLESSSSASSPSRTGYFLHDYPVSWNYVYMWDRPFFLLPTTPPL